MRGKQSFTFEQLNDLLREPNYRLFLSTAFAIRKQNQARFTIAGFARSAGLASRSFPVDVIAGRKRLTLQSLPGFISALGLNEDLKNYFTLLVSQSEESVRRQDLTLPEVKQALEKLKNRILSKHEQKIDPEWKQDAFQVKNWPEIYAALGSVETGSTIEMIVSRTGFKSAVCEQILEQMQELGIVEVRPGHPQNYFPGRSHLVLDALGDNEPFKKWFLALGEDAKERAVVDFESQENLFFGSCFSVRADRKTELRRELRELLLRFADEAEDPNGDKVAKIHVSFFT